MSALDDIPLAQKSRPQTLEEFIGQRKIWYKGSPLEQLVVQDRFHALIFWGPPGTGKTSLGELVGRVSERRLVQLSAVSCGVKEIRAAIDASQERRQQGLKSDIVFLDELHRLNRGQQDVLLPAIEQGVIKFIGATTENPSFAVNSALLSRGLSFQFTNLTEKDLFNILQQSLTKFSVILPEAEVLQAIAKASAGDARKALHLLEAVIHLDPTTPKEEIFYALSLRYDKSGEQHYDVISAFIKSIRASKPDAAIYYLARMLEGGERPEFIARRLVIAASEDIGNASPTALLIAQAALQASLSIGMPEARIILAQATTYLACSPKSNRSYLAVESALEDVAETGALEIPKHLLNAPTAFMKNEGRGQNYIYAHDNQKGAYQQSYLPEKLRDKKYYELSDKGAERAMAEYLRSLESPS